MIIKMTSFKYLAFRSFPEQCASAYNTNTGPHRQTVISGPTSPDGQTTALSSLKASRVLEQMCPECISEVQCYQWPNVFAVRTRSGQAVTVLLLSACSCGIHVVVYEPLPPPCRSDVIGYVDNDISDPELRVAKKHSHGQTSTVMLTHAHG